MPRYNLAAETRRVRNIRRSAIVLPEIVAPSALATDLFQIYKPMLDVWTAAAPRIAAEYERTLAQMTTDAPADVEREISQAANQASQIALTLTPSLRNWALRVERVVRDRWTRGVKSATGIDLSVRLGPADVAETLETYITWNTDLIRNVSDEIRQRVGTAVHTGLSQRRPAREVAKEINEATSLGRKRSLRIASDQLSKLSATLADDRRREAGIEVWEWRHSSKRHPRKHHVARDGLLYSDNPELVGKSVGGKVIHAPPDQGDRPGQPPFCGCRARAVMVFEFDNSDGGNDT